MEGYGSRIAAVCGMDASLEKLMGLFCVEASEAEIAGYFGSVEFDKQPSEVNCMAAVMSAANGYAGVPQRIKPRLQGIIKYVHTLNAGMIAALCELGKRCNEAGIPVLLLRSTALRLGWPSNLQQHIWGTQICVPAAEHPKVLTMLREMGYTVEDYGTSAAAARRQTERIILYQNPALDGLWEGAGEICVNGTRFLLPREHLLLISLLVDGFWGLVGSPAGKSPVRWFMDIHAFLTSAQPLDWEKAAAAAKARGVSHQMRLMLDIYIKLSRRELPQTVLDRFGTARDCERLLGWLEDYRTIPQGEQKLKRRWLYARLTHPEETLPAIGAFVEGGFRTLKEKITKRP